MKKTAALLSGSTLILVFALSFLYAAPAKNIIIMVGDGFGPGMYSFVKYYAQFVENIVETAMIQGKSAGLVTTDEATGATPAFIYY